MNSIQFDESKHEYKRNGDVYISVTTLLKKYGFSADYGTVPPDILARAAKRGKTVHKILEMYIKTGVIIDPTLLDPNEYDTTIDPIVIQPFTMYTSNRNIDLSQALSEEIIYNDTYKIAGTIDFQYTDGNDSVIADFKTTSQIHWDSVIWQLSIYNYIKCDGDVISYYMKQSKVFHMYQGSFTVKELPLIPFEEVQRLLEANLNDEPYTYNPDYSSILSQSEANIYEGLLKEIEAYKAETKRLQEKLDSLDEDIIKKMQSNNVPSVVVGDLKFRISERKGARTLDSSKVKEFFTRQGEDINNYYKEGKGSTKLLVDILKTDSINSIEDDVKELNK